MDHAPNTPAADDRRALRGARIATRAQFFALGFGFGTWGVHIPNAKLHFGLDDSQLSWALFTAAVGAVASLLVAGGFIQRLGPQRATALGGAVMMLALAALLRIEGPYALPLLALLMLLVGAGSALMDVSINAEGSQLETASGMKVMSGFHAMFSTGGMVGAAAGAALSTSAWTPTAQLTVIGVALAVAIIATSRHMLATQPVVDQERSRFSLPRGRLLLLGLLCAVGLLSEGAMYDWSVLYLEQDLHSSHALAALGFASFSAAMAIGRFGGDALRERFAPAPLLAGSALLSALAMAMVLAVGQPMAALFGFAFVGFGMANLVPILFMTASQTPGVAPSAAIAAVSALGYLGFVGGPPLIGAIAQAKSLTAALVLIVIACLAVAWGARRL